MTNRLFTGTKKQRNREKLLLSSTLARCTATAEAFPRMTNRPSTGAKKLPSRGTISLRITLAVYMLRV